MNLLISCSYLLTLWFRDLALVSRMYDEEYL
jgi:hypothetical protein